MGAGFTNNNRNVIVDVGNGHSFHAWLAGGIGAKD